MKRAYLGVGVAALLAAAGVGGLHAQSAQGPGMPQIDPDDIGGVVTGPAGPEAGVWVIAEAQGLGVRYIKAVVTGDDGRFVVPDLPEAKYQLWVRGYGLADSPRTAVARGATAALKVAAAKDAAEAAKVYPAAYWYSMLKIPAKADFAPATRNPDIASAITSQEQYLSRIKNVGCVGCHQMGNLATRTIPAAIGKQPSSTVAWVRRVQSGQAGADMVNQLNAFGPAAAKNFADWTDRIARGELPRDTPPRPQGIERNVVVTVRDWLDDQHYLHDLISTDRRNPTVNGYGPLYGATELSTNDIPILDPVKNTATVFRAPVRDADTPMAARPQPVQPSPYWGDKPIWDSRANVHNPMLDARGRVWLTATGRGPDNPAVCRAGSSHPSAKATPMERSGRQLAMLDPKTGKYTFIDTCFGTHHLQFDANDVLWTSGGGPVVGWLDAKLFEATGDAAKAQGWTALVIDANGNGRRDPYVEPGQPRSDAQDQRILAGFYAVMPSPADGSVWGSVLSYPGAVVRLDPGRNPPETALAEVFNVPAPGYGVRGADIDSQGVVWVSLGSGHLGSFDRRKCKGPLNGPRAATGDHCPEGWAFYKLPGPSFAAAPDESVESSYYTWVDQHDTLGLGKDVPIVTGNLFDGFHALVNGRFVTLRTPYPLGFYAKGLDGRIDDPKAGWKGRGLWSSSGDRTPWHMEGGKGNRPLAVHVQVRGGVLER
jgi:hypothetical protein